MIPTLENIDFTPTALDMSGVHLRQPQMQTLPAMSRVVVAAAFGQVSHHMFVGSVVLLPVWVIPLPLLGLAFQNQPVQVCQAVVHRHRKVNAPTVCAHLQTMHTQRSMC